jgi:hypothetical protein
MADVFFLSAGVLQLFPQKNAFFQNVLFLGRKSWFPTNETCGHSPAVLLYQQLAVACCCTELPHLCL